MLVVHHVHSFEEIQFTFITILHHVHFFRLQCIAIVTNTSCHFIVPAHCAMEAPVTTAVSITFVK